MNGPLFRQIKKFPFSAAFFTSVIMCIVFAPSFFCFRCIPDDLWVRTYEEIFSPSFQFLTLGTINHLIIFPVLCYPHCLFSSTFAWYEFCFYLLYCYTCALCDLSVRAFIYHWHKSPITHRLVLYALEAGKCLFCVQLECFANVLGVDKKTILLIIASV